LVGEAHRRRGGAEENISTTDGHGWTRIKKQEVDANGANWREFGHKERKENKMKDLHAASFRN